MIKQRCLTIGVVLLIALPVGCGGDPPAPKPAAGKVKPAAVKLTIMVVDDSALAEGVELQRGAWQAASGGDLEIKQVGLESALGKDSLVADVVIFPARLLGALVERGDLQPIRDSVLAQPALALADIYPAVRIEMKYGEKTFALPMGSPPLLPCYRNDVIKWRGGAPPATLAEFRELVAAARKAQPDNEVDPSSGDPVFATKGDAAAHLLLLRALAYVETSRRVDAMFNPEDMAPRIAEPPFERALTELIAEQNSAVVESPVDLVGAVGMVQRGSAGAAFGWPGIVSAPQDLGSSWSFSFGAAPASDQEFSTMQSAWQKQSLPEPVTYLGAAGRMMAVGRHSRNAVTAFQFCTWLSALDRVPQVSARSRQTLWFRRSQAGSHDLWTGGLETRGHGEASAKAVAAALDSEAPFVVPRIPGIDDYLSALGDAMRSALSGGATPAAALQQAAGKFEQLTEARGRKEQVRAYRRHLGLEEVEP